MKNKDWVVCKHCRQIVMKWNKKCAVCGKDWRN